MKHFVPYILRAAIGIVLIGKVLNWFFHFNKQTGTLLNIAMFCLIGIFYVLVARGWTNKLIKYIFLFCGIFLIAMNFIPEHIIINIAGIICILTPLLIARFSKSDNTIHN